MITVHCILNLCNVGGTAVLFRNLPSVQQLPILKTLFLWLHTTDLDVLLESFCLPSATALSGALGHFVVLAPPF
jgi:hypothetical protein